MEWRRRSKRLGAAAAEKPAVHADSPRFFIAIGGMVRGQPPPPAHASLLPCPCVWLAAVPTRCECVLVDDQVAPRPKNLAGYGLSPFADPPPSLHIMGAKDEMIQPVRPSAPLPPFVLALVSRLRPCRFR
eukprot:COSAG04_NODE_435_length_14466_cov_135.545486_8_plen_130_part_00